MMHEKCARQKNALPGPQRRLSQAKDASQAQLALATGSMTPAPERTTE